MLTQALSASTDMYKENGRILSVIEDKAQKAAGLAGIFLAAAFSFLRKDALLSLSEFMGWVGLFILALAIALMLCCVLTSAWALWASEMMTPPKPDLVLANVEARLVNATRLTHESLEKNLREQAKVWNQAVQVQGEAIAVKSKLLVWTQRLLVGGLSMVFALLWLSIFVYGTGKKLP